MPARQAASSLGLREAVLAEASQPRPGPANWHARLPPDLAAEASGLRDDLRAGVLRVTRWHLARLIARWLCQAGHHTTQQAVSRWLSEE